jgi:dTMP kinase
MSHDFKGKFVSMEGSEGSGKTTQREFIGKWLEAAGIEVVFTREPGGTPLAERIRELLLAPSVEQMAHKTELLLMFAARAQHLEEVVYPVMKRGGVVLCDRFVDSSIAYQHYGRGLPMTDLETMIKFTCGDFEPDLTFVLEIPFAVGLARASARGFLDRIELAGNAFFARVSTGYRTIALKNPERCKLIDANMDREQVQAQLIPHLQDLVNSIHSRTNIEKPRVTLDSKGHVTAIG